VAMGYVDEDEEKFNNLFLKTGKVANERDIFGNYEKE
jgi:hypothetical protein